MIGSTFAIESMTYMVICHSNHSLHNMAFVVLSLIHGTTRLQQDHYYRGYVRYGHRPVLPALPPSIVGAAVGYDGLDKRWIDPFNDHVKTVVAGFGHGSISGLVQRNIDLWEKLRNEPVP